ncbi:unnamed protein product [Allacma fusca]|uniref:THAP-type domain-containing protein n=1 Tax=Allacma fusca TaxID=39272 RepID=A0A8J2JJG9_9HEXA|nr:unnamed protein product [Allacma fusca]
MSNTYGGPTRMPSLTELADLEDQDVQFDNIIHRYQVCSREIQVLANAVQTRPVPVRRQHKCVFRACKAVEAQYDKITFHNIPQLVGPIRDAWIKAVRKSLNNPTWMPKKGEKVCSLHFDPKDILSPHEKTFIRREAFPTRFLESVIDNDKESMEQKIDIAGGAKISSVRVQTVGDRISPLQNTGCASGLSERMKRKLLRNIRADRTFIHDSETRESAQRRLAKVAKEAKRLKDVIKNLNRNLFLKNVKMKELRMEMSRTKSNFRKQNIGSIISMADSQLVPKLSKTFQKLWKKEVHGRGRGHFNWFSQSKPVSPDI